MSFLSLEVQDPGEKEVFYMAMKWYNMLHLNFISLDDIELMIYTKVAKKI